MSNKDQKQRAAYSQKHIDQEVTEQYRSHTDQSHTEHDPIIEQYKKRFETHRDAKSNADEQQLLHSPNLSQYESLNHPLQWTYIANVPPLKKFARKTQKELTHVLVALMTLKRGLVQRAEGTAEHGTNTVLDIIGNSVPFQGGSAISTVLKEAVSFYFEQSDKEKIRKAVSQIYSLNQLDRIAENTALNMVQRYQEQITDLEKNEAEKLAQASVAIMTDHIFSNQFKPDNPLGHELADAVSDYQSVWNKLQDKLVNNADNDQQLSNAGSQVKTALNKIFQTTIKTQSIGTVTAIELLTKPNIKALDDKNKIHYYQWRDKAELKFGFRLTTKTIADYMAKRDLVDYKGSIRPKPKNPLLFRQIPEQKPLTQKVESDTQYEPQKGYYQQKIDLMNQRVKQMEQNYSNLADNISFFNRGDRSRRERIKDGVKACMGCSIQ